MSLITFINFYIDPYMCIIVDQNIDDYIGSQKHRFYSWINNNTHIIRRGPDLIIFYRYHNLILHKDTLHKFIYYTDDNIYKKDTEYKYRIRSLNLNSKHKFIYYIKDNKRITKEKKLKIYIIFTVGKGWDNIDEYYHNYEIYPNLKYKDCSYHPLF